MKTIKKFVNDKIYIPYLARKNERRVNRIIREREQIANRMIEQEIEQLGSLSPDFYSTRTRQALSQEEKDSREHVGRLMNLRFKPSQPKPKTAIQAKKQLGIAMSRLKQKHIGSIDFDLTKFTNEDREYFYNHLPEFIHKFVKTINLDEHWVSYYAYEGAWKQRMIDSFTSKLLEEQIEKELEDNMSWVEYHEINYGFYPVSIRELKEFRFVNEDEVGLRGRANNGTLIAKDFKRKSDFNVYQSLLSSHADSTVMNKFLNKHLKNPRQGSFWKWINTFQELNLEIFGIFNEINPRTINLMERDNCFIYACKQWGLNEDLLNDMRYCIKTRSFSLSDIKRISETLGLSFKIKVVREETKNIFIGENSETLAQPINLILFHEHYMIDKKVNISPYYIKHRDEINANVKKMNLTERLKINGYEWLPDKSKKIYTKSKKQYSIIKVLRAIFESNGFRPIKMNEVYDNMLCFEDILEDDDLSFDSKLCCRKIICK